MLDRERIANRAARMFGGKSRSAVTATAFLALLGVLIAGAVLASRANDVREQLQGSRIVAAMTGPSEKGLLSQLLDDPQGSALLLKYIDSLAGAVENMEASPKWRLSQFGALLDASRHHDISIEKFSGDPQAHTLTVYCTGLDGDAGAFVRELDENGCFSSIAGPVFDAENRAKFTILCDAG